MPWSTDFVPGLRFLEHGGSIRPGATALTVTPKPQFLGQSLVKPIMPALEASSWSGRIFRAGVDRGDVDDPAVFLVLERGATWRVKLK